MKKLFFILIAAMMAVSGVAQEKAYPTKFLGIPIDGTKADMIRKIQAKGYTLHKEDGTEYLTGEFNGAQVNVYIGTNKNKVNRIAVAEQAKYPASEIIVRFNSLMKQFNDNPNYASAVRFQTYLPSDEDITYEMVVNNKRYDAYFVQITHDVDTTLLQQDAMEIMENIDQHLSSALLSQMSNDVLAQYCLLEAFSKQYEKNTVWFKIAEYYGDYYLVIYYDNDYNSANGEDL